MNTRVDKIFNKVRDNPFLSTIIVVGIVVVSISTFAGSLKGLINTVNEVIGTTPIDVTGIWKWIQDDGDKKTYFEFEVIDNRIIGKVWMFPKRFWMEHGGRISNSRIEGNIITFKTTHSYTNGKYVDYYRGKVVGDEIHFIVSYNNEDDEAFIATKTRGIDIDKKGNVVEISK